MRSVSSPETRPRLLIADAQALFADALRAFLTEKNYAVVGWVPNTHSLITEAIDLKPDLTIVDVSLPPLNGLDTAQKIKAQVPNSKFLFLSEREDLNLATTALEFAPAGFVLKHGTGQELLDAIRNVLRYQSYLPPRLRSRDWVEAKVRARRLTKGLTLKQKHVVQLLAEGRKLTTLNSLNS